MKTQLLQSCRWVGPFRQGLPSQSSQCPSQLSLRTRPTSPCPSQPFPCPSQTSQCTSQPSLRTRPTIPMPIPTISITCRVFIVVSILSVRVEGNFLGNCFCTGASRTFFTAVGRFLFVVSSDVMLCMTVGGVMMAPRKTCFPAAIGATATMAEPSEDATAFCVIRFTPMPKSMVIAKLNTSTIKQILEDETSISHPATHKSKPEIVKSYLEMMIKAISGYISVMPLPFPVAIYIIMCIPTAYTLHSSVGDVSALFVPNIPLLPPIIVLFPPITTPILTIIPLFMLQFKKILNNDRRNDIFISYYQILMLTFANEIVLTGRKAPETRQNTEKSE